MGNVLKDYAFASSKVKIKKKENSFPGNGLLQTLKKILPLNSREYSLHWSEIKLKGP
jgi:hypothetical protein